MTEQAKATVQAADVAQVRQWLDRNEILLVAPEPPVEEAGEEEDSS